MTDEGDELRRVRFYGANDLSVGRFVSRVVELATQFDPKQPPPNTVDILELQVFSARSDRSPAEALA